MSSGQGEAGPSKRQKLLACQRCRHRKQKCTEARPCENCTQSGAECLPTLSASSKASLEPDYVQRLEERVAQLESLVPQESLDHINSTHQEGRPPSRRRLEPDVRPLQNEGPVNSTSMPVAQTSPDNFSFGLFGTISGVQTRLAREDDSVPEVLDLDLELELFLAQTYFEMAHSQYPFLLKHRFFHWAESWRNSRGSCPPSQRWQGFLIYMVYAIAFLMTKTRINGAARSQAMYLLATSRYLPYLVAAPDPIIRAQGFLLLTLYALHMPSKENIITLSSWTMRFCIMAQLHLVEAEPEPLDSETLIQIQHRRRVFWCAYGIDRAVCSSYDYPYSIPDSHITVPIFDNIDDDQLLAINSTSILRQNLNNDSMTPTSVSAVLHVLRSRQLESEIQETVLRKDYNAHSDEAAAWRMQIGEKLKDWDRISITLSRPSQKGYVSPRWLKMIYYYNIIMLYRPTRGLAQGIAGDLSVQACCQALLLFRRLQMAREIAQPWLGLLTQFQIGVTLLYCFHATPTALWRPSYKSADVPDAIRACSSTLAILAERWSEVECVRDVFEILAREVPLGETWDRPARMSAAGQRGILEEHWQQMSEIVIHRPTLLMIREMATEPFVSEVQLAAEERIHTTAVADTEAATSLIDGMDLRWDDAADGHDFSSIVNLEPFSDHMYFQL